MTGVRAPGLKGAWRLGDQYFEKGVWGWISRIDKVAKYYLGLRKGGGEALLGILIMVKRGKASCMVSR